MGHGVFRRLYTTRPRRRTIGAFSARGVTTATVAASYSAWGAAATGSVICTGTGAATYSAWQASASGGTPVQPGEDSGLSAAIYAKVHRAFTTVLSGFSRR